MSDDPNARWDELRRTLQQTASLLRECATTIQQQQVALEAAAKQAGIEKTEAERLRHMFRFEQQRSGRLLRVLSGIHGLMYPPPIKLDDGRTMRFCPPDPHDYLQALSDRIRAIPDEIEAIDKAGDPDRAK